jgi:uncharacterized protein
MSIAAPHWRTRIEDYIRREAQPPEKYGHQPRLYELTKLVGEGLDYDDDVVFAAAWMHDLGVFVGHRPEEPAALARWDNVAYAIEKTPAVLEQFGFPTEKIPAVLEVIRTHQPSAKAETIEAAILRDADLLEQLGAVAILRTVAKVGRDTRFHTYGDAVNSLRKASDSLPHQIALDRTRSLAEPKVRLLREFLDAAEGESLSLPL